METDSAAVAGREAGGRRGETTLARVAGNVGAGSRLLLFRQVAPEVFRADATQVVLLVILGVIWDAALQYAAVATQAPEFNRWGLSAVGALTCIELGAVYFVAAAARRLDELTRLLVVLLAMGPLATLLMRTMAWLAGTGALGMVATGILGIGVGAYLFVAVARALRLVLSTGVGRSALLTLAYTVLTGLGAAALPSGDLWYVLHDDASSEPEVDVEALYYAQPQRLAAELDTLKAQRPGIVDLYLVGFAGWAEQDVFLREVTAVKQLFDERFDSAGRSLLLLNNPRTADTLPLANAHNLEHALDAVAQRMDPEEDVLFLFLTSHGSEDHLLSVSFWPLGLNDLSAPRLRGMLDAAGIRNRVIVVSACYSGGFIDALRDDHTLVITASAPDRQSFGCGHSNDFTWFGKAYFDEALREQYDFVAAYDQAATRIAEREKAESQLASRPQIAEGAAIAPVLKSLEQRLQAQAQKQAQAEKVPAAAGL